MHSRINLRTLLIICGGLLLLVPSVSAALGPGSLDPSFGGTGKVTTSISTVADLGRAIATQPDGKILVAGESYIGSHYQVALVRYNPDGSLDTTFNGSGKVTTNLVNEVYGWSLALQTDGKILVGGTRILSDPFGDAYLIRYNSDGSLDTSFNGTGIVTAQSTGGGFAAIYSIAVQPDNKIVGVGSVGSGDTATFAIFRFNSNGTPDTTLNGTGQVGSPIGTAASYARSVQIQTDGKIVAAGSSKNASQYVFTVARYNSNGTLDSTFNGSGIVTTVIGPRQDQIISVALQPDNKIVVAGSSLTAGPSIFALARYNSDGTLDITFNGTGKATINLGGSCQAESIALQQDGKILVGGSDDMNVISQYRFGLVRYLPSGILDTTFGANGIVLTSVGSLSDQAHSMAVQANGRILLAGITQGTSDANFAVVRYFAAAPVVAFDYDGDSKSDISVFRPSTGEWYLLRSGAGLYGVGFGAMGDKIAPADYDGDGKADVAVYRPSNNVWYVLNSGTGTVSYHVFGAAEDLPTPADYDGDGKADLSVFRPSSGTWYRINSSNNSFFGYQFGQTGDKPALGDFDGDGKADISIYRPSDGTWYRVNSGSGTLFGTQFGAVGDLMTAADYDGDGKTDIAVFRPSIAAWYRLNSTTGSFVAVTFGAANDIPAPGDFDGDGKADVNVFRPSDGNWYRLNSSNNAFVAQPFGANGDLPTPAAFRF